MTNHKLLSADLLDILFDNRNKDYGAYELRRSYNKRIKRALLLTAFIFAVITVGAVFTKNNGASARLTQKDSIALKAIVIPEDDPVVIPPPKQVQPVARTVDYVAFKIVEQTTQDPPPTTDEVSKSVISDFSQDGPDPTNIVVPEEISTGLKAGIIAKKEETDEIYTGPVQSEASYDGNWLKFLNRNLDPQVPADNGAPAGDYRVVIQFVVDKEGNISDVRALTNMGYGMEQEAMRVIRKSLKWTPAFQGSHYVKAYRKQPITFQVLGD